MSTSEEKAFPLCWPIGWKRTAALSRVNAHFGIDWKRPVSVTDAVVRVLNELRRMSVGDWNVIVSTDVPLRLDGRPRPNIEPSDPGAAIYWRQGEAQRCIAIDRYTRLADNLAAIAATLEVFRAIERRGGAEMLERAFTGFAELPATPQL